MASYEFQSITAAQALAFDNADILRIFDSLNRFTVSFNDAAGAVTLTDTGSGRAVVFGSGIANALITGPAAVLRIGSPSSDFSEGGTYVYAGSGNDIITGGSFVYGGPGDDIFVTTYAKSISEIRDWQVGDRLYMSTIAATAANYVESIQPTATAAETFAKEQLLAGKDYVVVAVGADLRIFADYTGGNAIMSQTTVLGRGLADISEASFLSGAAPRDPLLPPLVTGAHGQITGNMDAQHLHSLLGAEITDAEPTFLTLEGEADLRLTGQNFTYDGDDQITGGVVTRIVYSSANFKLDLEVPSIPAASFGAWLLADATELAFSTILAGVDGLIGSTGADLLRGYGGNDLLQGAGGQDSLFGGLGDDFIYATYKPDVVLAIGVGASYLRGDEGNDRIGGAGSFDDINGNMGNDTCSGGAGDDWVVGGKDNDSLTGDAGGDLVYGNLGADTCEGGDGNDIVRGGQDDDVVGGGAGDDFVSGDKGSDTMTGGAGADSFHTFGDAGLDRVTDFRPSEGDRVQLDPGTQHTVAQVGADTVISMAGGGQMILVGVQLSALTPGWIFGA